MPWSMACFAPSRTGSGTSVSQTPWARLMPCIFSQAIDMARISDCTVRAARRLRERGIGHQGHSNCKSGLRKTKTYHGSGELPESPKFHPNKPKSGLAGTPVAKNAKIENHFRYIPLSAIFG